ncbi:hypothetical protein KC887_03285 [Candidatus Kaiserbacteria bacterium]|nr:hypothetical protein [Candidatus Kaiserbacteria bacterium]
MIVVLNQKGVGTLARRIIEGKLYDTNTAVFVSKHHSLCRCLYVTQKGSWFTTGSTGTDPAIQEVLTADQANKWLLSSGDGDALKKYFPDSIENA